MGRRSSDRGYFLLGLRIVGDFGATIAVPVVLFAWAGKALDARWGTGPIVLILGFALAAGLSALSIARKARTYGRRYQELLNAEKKEEGSAEGGGSPPAGT